MASRIYTDEEEMMIGHLYQSGISARAIARVYGTYHSTMINVFHRIGLVQRPPDDRNRLYAANAHAFDSIDNEQAAYWLGFLYADGCISRRTLSIGLSSKDLEHLQALKKFMQSEAPIGHHVVLGKYQVIHFEITDIHLAETLNNLGISKDRNNLYACLRAIPPNLINHFIRGLFDGDGSARKNPCMVFLGSLDLMLFIRKALAENVGTNPNLKPYQHTKSRHMYYLYYMRRRQSLRIASYLYRDATIWLHRKRQRIEGWPAPRPSGRKKRGADHRQSNYSNSTR